MVKVQNIVKALALTAADQVNTVASAVLGPMVKGWSKNLFGILPKTGTKWLTGPLLTERAVDGAILNGVVPSTAYAKYVIKKGLPKDGQRRLAIENEAHTVDDFSGVIKSGYGKGTKTLVFSGVVPVKVGDKSFFGKANIHLHNADRAGTHFDIVVEGVDPGTNQWEVNIPSGEFTGRYSFVKTSKGMIVVPMKDRGVLLPKPRYNLKPLAFLEKVQDANDRVVGNKVPYIVEWKPDGSLANVEIGEHRAVFRSHRESANSYYDKLPALEFLRNTSRFAIWRMAFPRFEQVGSVLKGELVHPDGVSRVSGILNSYPARAKQAQDIRGPVEFYAWDLVKLAGKDVSHLPYGDRRRLLEDLMYDVRFFNKHWHVVEACKPHGNVLDFYNKVINDPRGLPWSEGIVIKDALGDSSWWKVKAWDDIDLEILPGGFVKGKDGKYSDTLGALLCRDPHTGNLVTVGTGFSDTERKWIWRHRKELDGTVIKANVFTQTEESFRAPRFDGFHPDARTGSEFGLTMYGSVA
jgi:DNA ligase OB-like domain/ATP dependent DNA ligase domain